MTTTTLPQERFVEGSLPMYEDISLLTAERHGVAALLGSATFEFAAGTPAIPLTADEFERAALDYPIVFIGPTRRAFAVTSLAQDRNPFVDRNGDYRAGAYIPAYLRRHPFVLVRDPNQGQWVLAIDEYSTRLAPLGEADARPLFDGGAPSAVTLEAVAFCEAYENAQQRTERLVQLLDELELFESRQAHHVAAADRADSEPVLLLDYVAVNRSRFEALDAGAVSRLREIGGLGPIYAHLLSEANWERLTLAGA